MDKYSINVNPVNKEEEYIIREAKSWLTENMFSSNLGESEHIKNVVNLGRKNIDFLMEILKENDRPDGVYAHFVMEVVYRLYKTELDRDVKVEGYIGVSGWVKLLLKLYENGWMNEQEGDIDVTID